MATASGCSASTRVEHPVALQLGGSNPAELAASARSARIRLRRDQPQCRLPVGPRAGRRFGACLMAEPRLVAEVRRGDEAAVMCPSR
jgi:tRNA-dihydrouridine synthase A